jgi:hypothetical protein
MRRSVKTTLRERKSDALDLLSELLLVDQSSLLEMRNKQR